MTGYAQQQQVSEDVSENENVSEKRMLQAEKRLYTQHDIVYALKEAIEVDLRRWIPHVDLEQQSPQYSVSYDALGITSFGPSVFKAVKQFSEDIVFLYLTFSEPDFPAFHTDRKWSTKMRERLNELERIIKSTRIDPTY